MNYHFVAIFILENAGGILLYINTHVLVAPVSLAAAGVAEEATLVVGAAVGRTVEVGVWESPLLFLRLLLPVSFQVKHELCFIFTLLSLDSISDLITLGFLDNQGFFPSKTL